ncbi:ParB N-terminal domain-containing protein [Salinimonas sediminis]|uniref:ParB/Sulfiredoxin domain-containing protein n=1 Tax=Salinimonas sediminis TaxID=2303538 RepID=A0A346NRD2_9ALTE|nr:ParB N-terminal domain-containing protein [Salinimonas sediminis]AXR08089.1 hypothetical protein D0Y50_18070 [Salinimonas sediminis]
MERKVDKWWDNRVIRSVDNLKLWSENPRLDASSKLVTLKDYVEELISDANDEQNFLSLLRSIASRGFLSFDPIVVWQDQETKNFIVAEGNRRVMALKLLRSPEKAPMSIRKTVVNLSRTINRESIEKIKVCLAPSYEDARWYILQRHSAASTQVRWQRLQQQRFIINAYDSVGQDIDETASITGFKRATIVEALRYVKLRDIAARNEVTTFLTTEEKEQVYSHRISMTVLERWFGNSQVREAWFIEFKEDGVFINADADSFYKAYAKLLKLMLNKENELGYLVNTRTIDAKFQEIFDCLPVVHKVKEQGKTPSQPSEDYKPPVRIKDNETTSRDEKVLNRNLKGNPKRRQFTDRYHEISTRSYKLKALFKELQKLPIYNYPNVAAASIRVFLELAVDEFVFVSDLKESISKDLKKGYHEVTLSQKLITLKGQYIDDRESNKIIEQLLQTSNDFSLNTLNEYIHGTKIHKIEPQFLNRFWDMLSPLFLVLINLKEI